MSIQGQSNTSLTLSVALLLSLLSLIVMAVMALFQISMGKASDYTIIVLFSFAILPATIMSWISLAGRLMFLHEYDNHQDAVMKATITLALAIVLTTFSYFMVVMII